MRKSPAALPDSTALRSGSGAPVFAQITTTTTIKG
jgi:hypothetical protein